MIYLKVSLRRKILETGRSPFWNRSYANSPPCGLIIGNNNKRMAIRHWLEIETMVRQFDEIDCFAFVDARERVRLNPSIYRMSCVIMCLVPNRRFFPPRIIACAEASLFRKLCCGEWKRKRMTCTKALGTVLMCVWFQRPYCMTSATCSLK